MRSHLMLKFILQIIRNELQSSKWNLLVTRRVTMHEYGSIISQLKLAKMKMGTTGVFILQLSTPSSANQNGKDHLIPIFHRKSLSGSSNMISQKVGSSPLPVWMNSQINFPVFVRIGSWIWAQRKYLTCSTGRVMRLQEFGVGSKWLRRDQLRLVCLYRLLRFLPLMLRGRRRKMLSRRRNRQRRMPKKIKKKKTRLPSTANGRRQHQFIKNCRSRCQGTSIKPSMREQQKPKLNPVKSPCTTWSHGQNIPSPYLDNMLRMELYPF